MFVMRGMKPNTESDEESSVGRPKLDNNERHSDPENSIRSKQAKDSENGKIEEISV